MPQSHTWQPVGDLEKEGRGWRGGKRKELGRQEKVEGGGERGRWREVGEGKEREGKGKREAGGRWEERGRREGGEEGKGKREMEGVEGGTCRGLLGLVVVRLLWVSGRALVARVRGVLGLSPGDCRLFSLFSISTL